MPLPDLKLRVPAEEITPLATLLRKAGYEETSIAKLLRVIDISQIDANQLPYYIWLCRKADSELSKLVLFLFLMQPMARKEVSKLIPRELLGSLQMCGLLHRESGQLSCRVVVYPCLGQIFVTDHWASLEPQKPGHIYELGLDSYALARLTPRRPETRALDICTGSGIHGIQSSFICAQSTVVDINPRALEYTKFNCALNATEVEAHLGDLYAPVKERTFDLITVNPPFVPTPDREVLVHRSPGESGEEVSERLVNGLPEHLATGGLFSMILNYPIVSHESYLDRLERWLGQTQGWIIACMDLVRMELPPYIRGHMSPLANYHQEYVRYLDSYDKLGIEAMSLANVFIIRTDRKQPNHKVQFKSTPSPNGIRKAIDHWLHTQVVFSDNDFEAPDDWAPSQHRYIKTVWRDQEEGTGAVQPGEDNYIPGAELTELEAERLSQLRGKTKCGELRDRWGLSRSELSQYLLEFGLKYLIETPES